MNNILLINSSSRVVSNSEILAKKVLSGIDFDEVFLKENDVKNIQDHRFDKTWPKQVDDYYEICNKLKNAKLIIFSTPIYWYGISSILKDFIDRWSESLKVDNEFRYKMTNKDIALVMVGGDHPRIKGSNIIEQFNYICDFLNMNFIFSLIGEADSPGSIVKDSIALIDAKNRCSQIKKIIKGDFAIDNVQ
ncbi:flavodoxin family protein [Bombilactobacillus bombi]|uniref:flavodoxin family protein n=1 Tax=Bombilactobacillus bombi TaxID=1303590 RepID=UPI000E577700|nr:NAD(P)H-dependent oxidoreductase [Bombilactobacillus bombi]AXX64471.1 flavodoxin family protein [Bombilactobacillus bombi]